MFKKFFLSCLLLPFIINVNNRQQINLNNKFKLKSISTILTNDLLSKKPLTIEERYYQLTINNQIKFDERYQFFNQILDLMIVKANNNLILLKKYQQLKDNWNKQYLFTINNQYNMICFLLLGVFVYFVFFIIRHFFKVESEKISSYLNNFKYLVLINNYDCYIKKEFVNNEINNKFYIVKYLLEHFFIENNVKKIINEIDNLEQKLDKSNHNKNNCDLCKLKLKTSIESNKFDFFHNFIWVNFQNYDENYSISYFIGNKLFNNVLNSNNFAEDITNKVTKTFDNLKKTFNFNEKIDKIKEIINNSCNQVASFIKEHNDFINSINKYLTSNSGSSPKDDYKTNIIIDKKHVNFNINMKIFLNFIKKNFWLAINERKSKRMVNETADDYYYEIYKWWDNFKEGKKNFLYLCLLLWLMFINFLIANYLFDGYRYLINSLRLKDKIIINGFTFIKQNDRFCVDDGFIINHNGITCYRLSNILTLCNCWEFIIQFGFDVLIMIFSILALFHLKSFLMEFMLHCLNFIIPIIATVIVRIFSIIYYCCPSWQQKWQKIKSVYFYWLSQLKLLKILLNTLIKLFLSLFFLFVKKLDIFVIALIEVNDYDAI